MSLADTKVGVEDCPTCKKNQFTVYADGHGICGACKYFRPATIKDPDAQPDTGQNVERVTHPKDKRLVHPDHRSFERLANARLEKDTLIKMGYFTGSFSGQRLQIAPLHNEEGSVVAQQITKPDGSRFILKGSTPYEDDKLWLFGRACFGDRYDRRVVVCQSPKDAAATAQAGSHMKHHTPATPARSATGLATRSAQPPASAGQSQRRVPGQSPPAPTTGRCWSARLCR